MLRIEHLTKTYGEKKAVDDLNLHIAPGEIYGFIGHNGAGKTTTMKSVAGIQQFDAGEIYIDGKSIRTEPIECKRICILRRAAATDAESSGHSAGQNGHPLLPYSLCLIMMV